MHTHMFYINLFYVRSLTYLKSKTIYKVLVKIIHMIYVEYKRI